MAARDVTRVLVVDDDMRVCRAVKEWLDATDGLRVSAWARTLGQAPEADAMLTPDVALVDVMLPRQSDGIAVITALAERGRTVVAMSVSSGVRDASLAAGAVECVEKALDPRVLRTALEQAGERARRGSEG